MKSLKRFLFAFILLFVFCMVSCGKNNEKESSTKKSPDVTQVAKAESSGEEKEPTEAPTEIPSETPAENPTEEPTEVPTETPAETPTENPTEAPTEVPSPEPTVKEAEPEATETPKPTATETPKPAATATPKPAATSTPKPKATATPKPKATATPKPTATSTPKASSGIKINNYSSVAAAQSVPSNDATKFVSKMTVGFNLGNEFDAYNCTWLNNELDYESAWSGAKTTNKFLDTVYNAGFNTIRIPVSWHDHVDGNYNINKAWLNRVTEVVKYCYDKGMYVILNVHHDVDANYYYPTNDKYEQSAKYMKAVWSQLASHFSGYGERLIFESINEPRLTGTSIEWWVSNIDSQWGEAIENIVKLNQVFVDTVRATGGNNSKRFLMVPSYADAPDPALSGKFSLPNDSAKNRIILTFHTYSSYNFAQNTGNGSTTKFDNSVKNENLNQFKNLYNKYVKNGIPVVIGEFGCVDKNNEQDFTDYMSYVVGVSKQYGMRAVVWDNNAFNTTGAVKGSGAENKFGLINRKSCKIVKEAAIKAMMQYYK